MGIVGNCLRKSFVIPNPSGGSVKSTVPAKDRILICAPSNAAVDEITRRLKKGIMDSKGKKFVPSVIRLGTGQVHFSVEDVTLEYRLNKELEKNIKDPTEEKRRLLLKEIENQKEIMAALREEFSLEKSDDLNRKRFEVETNHVNKRIRSLSIELSNLKSSNYQSQEKVKRELRIKILSEAEVILCTLSGAGHECLKSFEFPTVIIDEACQSIEISSLIPLQYGCTKCILVGGIF